MCSHPPQWGPGYGRQAAAFGFADAVCRQDVEEVAELVLVWSYRVRLELAGMCASRVMLVIVGMHCWSPCLYGSGAECKRT